MIIYKKKIGIVIYANPDHYPPVINTIQILAKEFDLVVICRNQEKPQLVYPQNVRLYRLGRLKTAREKEAQNFIIKILEYLSFAMHVVFYVRSYQCKLIYAYDAYGLLVGFIASRFGKKMPLIYHNLDLE